MGATGAVGKGNVKNIIKSGVYAEFGFKDANDSKLLAESKSADAERLAKIANEVGTNNILVGFDTTGGDLNSLTVQNGKIYLEGKDVTSPDLWNWINNNENSMKSLRDKIQDAVDAKKLWESRIDTLSSKLNSEVYSKLPNNASNPKLLSLTKSYATSGLWNANVQYTATRPDGSTYVTDQIVKIPDSVWIEKK